MHQDIIPKIKFLKHKRSHKRTKDKKHRKHKFTKDKTHRRHKFTKDKTHKKHKRKKTKKQKKYIMETVGRCNADRPNFPGVK